MPSACVLICTFDRPELLRRLLVALAPQAKALNCPTVIVDNGVASSEAVVSLFFSEMSITYHRLLENGLVSARNKSINIALESSPKYLVFIDDDEAPEPGWLSGLIEKALETGADIVTGTVVPEFAVKPPRWAVDGEFFYVFADSLGTGTLLLQTSVLPEKESQLFHQKFNFSGGEDAEFLHRLVTKGARHVQAQQAIVREWVPAERLKFRYLFRRGIRDGALIAQIAALKCTRSTEFLVVIFYAFFGKFFHAINHLFWSVIAPWRFVRAGQDFATMAGIVLRALGFKFVLYGQLKKMVALESSAPSKVEP